MQIRTGYDSEIRAGQKCRCKVRVITKRENKCHLFLGFPQLLTEVTQLLDRGRRTGNFGKTDSTKSVDNEKTNKLATLSSPYFQNIFQKLQKNTFILKQTNKNL